MNKLATNGMVKSAIGYKRISEAVRSFLDNPTVSGRTTIKRLLSGTAFQNPSHLDDYRAVLKHLDSTHMPDALESLPSRRLATSNILKEPDAPGLRHWTAADRAQIMMDG